MRSCFATRRLFVRLSEADAEKLIELARAERRHPGDQAAVLIADALKNQAAKAAEYAGGAK